MRVRNFLLLSIIAITTPFLSANPDNGAEVLLPNESVSDTINQNSFKYYKIDLKKGETLTGLIDELSADADLYIKEGELPTRSSFDCRSTKGSVHIDSCNITVENSGFVYIGVYGYQTAEYRLLGTVIKEIDDHANTKEGATEIELNSVTHGRINGNDDRDFFKLVVPTHQYVTIFTEGGTDTFGRLYSEDGTKIIEHDDIDNPGGNKNFKIAKNLFAGTYYLEVKDYYAHKSGDYELNLLSMEIEADDHGDTKERATEVALNSRTKGRADGHEDVDFFKIVVPEIKRVTLSTEGSTDMFGTLYDANGVKIASHDDIDHARGNKNFKIEETLAKGTYYIKVHHYYKNRTGDYFFIVTSEEVEEDDHGDVKESATEVGLNSSTEGKIGSRGDIDFFKITLPNKKRVSIHTEGSTDMFGELFDANGTKLAQHDDIDHNGGNKNFKIVKELNAGVYYIKARHYYRNQVGNYLLKVSSEDLEADTVAPVITLNGESNLSLVQGSAYSEPGATALDDRDGNVSVAISGTVNTNVVGEYTVIYTAKDRANNSSTKTRMVHVVLPPDVTAPVITLNGDESITLIQGSEYVEQNATALDDRDGNVTVTISGRVNTNVVGEYTVTYTAKDRANNSSTKMRMVHVVLPPDVTAPVITLNGDATITLIKGDEYNELGATATDDVDGDVNVTISGEVDTSTVGTYTITYKAVDSVGNEASLTREVNVVEAVIKYGVNISKVEGNTAKYHSVARFYVSLKTRPEANVTIPLSSSDENEGKVISLDGDSDRVIFTPDNWSRLQAVLVQGENKNVVDGIQNYTIILGDSISDDANYDGINPNDVEMKGLVLTLTKPVDTTNFIATLPKIMCPKVTYNGSEDLNYTLTENPDGMIIENETGCVMWEAPLSEEGNSHRVTIDVTDGSKTKTVSFDIHVSNTEALQSETHDNLVSITAQNTTLSGMKFRFLGNNPNIPTIRKVQNQGLVTVSNGIQVLSDYFYADENNSDDVEVLIPVTMLSDIYDFPRLSLYYMGKDSRYNAPTWNMTSMNLKVESINGVDYGVLSIGSLKGVMFIGVSPKIVGRNIPILQKTVTK